MPPFSCLFLLLLPCSPSLYIESWPFTRFSSRRIHPTPLVSTSTQCKVHLTGKRIDQMAGCNGDSPASSAEQQTVTEKKFGGIAPKKPLISKDHERAYFDSADWVLGKQSASNSEQAAAIESLKPKLKRTPHHQLPPRKPACASS